MITRVGNNCYCLKVKGQKFYLEVHNRAAKFFFTRTVGGYKFNTIFKKYGFDNHEWWNYEEVKCEVKKISGYYDGMHWNGCPYFKTKGDLLGFFYILDKSINKEKAVNFIDLNNLLL